MSNNQNHDPSPNQTKINDKLKLLEDKLRFLTLTYISIVDNAIRQIAEKKLGYNQDKIVEDKTDIFGTKTFIKFLENENKGQKMISNDDKIKFFSELKNQLFFPIDEDKTLNDALLNLENKNLDHNNFYLIHAHIYALRQKCVHGVCDEIPNSNFGKLLEKILIDAKKNNQDNQNNYVSTAIHYKYLFLLMPNSFCNELINLFLALSKIQEKWQFSYNKIIELYAQNEIIFNTYFNVKSMNVIAKKNIKFFKQVYFIRSNKNYPSGSIIKNKKKYNLIGKDNYHNLQEIVKEFNKIVKVKNSIKVKTNAKICFEEMEKIIAIIIKINLILRIYVTDLYNRLNKKQKNKSGIKSLRNDIDHSNLLGIFIDHNANQQQLNKKYSLKNWLDNLQSIEKFINKYSSNNSSIRNYLSLKNQLIQVLENKDFLIIKAIEKKPKNPKKPNIQLLRFTLKKNIEKNDLITRKKINKNLIKSKINSHRQKNLNYDYRLIKFHQYAKFKTILLRKLLNQKKIII